MRNPTEREFKRIQVHCFREHVRLGKSHALSSLNTASEGTATPGRSSEAACH